MCGVFGLLFFLCGTPHELLHKSVSTTTPPTPLFETSHQPSPGCRLAGLLANIPARLTKHASSSYIRFVDMRSAGPVSFLPPRESVNRGSVLQCFDRPTLMLLKGYCFCCTPWCRLAGDSDGDDLAWFHSTSEAAVTGLFQCRCPAVLHQ